MSRSGHIVKLAVLLLLLGLSVTAWAEEESSPPQIFIDLDGDGFEDRLEDADGNGIPESFTLPLEPTTGAGVSPSAEQRPNPFASQSITLAQPPAPASERFGLRSSWCLDLSGDRLDLAGAFGGGGFGTSAGSSGGCSGGACAPH